MRTNQKGFRSLIAWQEAKKLALSTYSITKKFPSSERFNLIDQLVRASTSAMSNLAEGYSMGTSNHRKAYYIRSKGSTNEVESLYELAKELEYINIEEYENIVDQCARLGYLIDKLARAT